LRTTISELYINFITQWVTSSTEPQIKKRRKWQKQKAKRRKEYEGKKGENKLKMKERKRETKDCRR
jgi:hypothetical protein